MPCGLCNSKKSGKTSQKTVVNYSFSVTSECEYTAELMITWLQKLECIKAGKLFEEIGVNKYKVNFAIGTVQSAINLGNPCKFHRKLDEISSIILASAESC